MSLLPLCLTLALSVTPAETVAAALADLERAPAETRGQTRYLALEPGVGGAEQAAAAVDYLLNAVSRARRIARSERVAQGDLLRIDLAAYADLQDAADYPRLHAAWERLAAADPYFHLNTQVLDPATAATDTPAALRTVTVDGGWVGLMQAERLRRLSGSFGAVLRADYFLASVATSPAYYEWAAVPEKEEELLAQLGLDLKTINRLAADSAANLVQSQVTGKPRRVIYRPGPLGGNWLTKDVLREAPDKDPLRAPVDFKEQRFAFDAVEVFYARANGLWGTAPAGHQQLTPLVSCLRCHELGGGQHGLQPFADDQSRLPLPESDEPSVTRRVAELYDPARLARELRRNREDYAAAVAAATGLEPSEAAEALLEQYAGYVYRAVTSAQAADELGLPAAGLSAALAGSQDPIAWRLSKGQSVSRKQWEASFAGAILQAEAFRLSGEPEP